jgi:hypothetical protein
VRSPAYLMAVVLKRVGTTDRRRSRHSRRSRTALQRIRTPRAILAKLEPPPPRPQPFPPPKPASEPSLLLTRKKGRRR